MAYFTKGKKSDSDGRLVFEAEYGFDTHKNNTPASIKLKAHSYESEADAVEKLKDLADHAAKVLDGTKKLIK